MSEESKTSQPDKAEVEEYEEERDRLQPDPLLGALVESTRVGSDGLRVILTVGGGLIAGTTVNRVDWARELRETYRHTYLEGVEKRWTEEEAEAAAEDEADEPPLLPSYKAFVHLRDARWIFGDSTVPAGSGPGMLWRGRLSEVQGFAFGSISQS